MTRQTVKFVSGLWGATALLLLTACSEPGAPGETALPEPTERGHSPWVFRSVLDKTPRMVTLALNEKFWAAYSTETGALVKAWRDGVDFDGAVYATTSHGPQPASIGPAYLQADNAVQWRVGSGDNETLPDVQYLGHRFADGHVTLRYRLDFEWQGASHSATVSETPEIRIDDTGKAEFFRAFQLDTDAPEARFRVVTPTAPASASAGIAASGEIEIQQPDDATQPGIALVDIAPEGQTLVTTTFEGPPALPAPEAPEAPQSPVVGLIERSGCTACHAWEERTVGPSFKEIAERYEPTREIIDRLATKVINGGSGVWGEVPMPPNDIISQEQAQRMVAFILGADESIFDAPPEPLPGDDTPMSDVPDGHIPGAVFSYYHIDQELSGFPVVEAGALPNKIDVFPRIDVHFWPWHPDVHLVQGEYNRRRLMVVEAASRVRVTEPGTYRFATGGTGPHRLLINGQIVLYNSATDQKSGEITLEAGFHDVRLELFVTGEGPILSLLWQPPGAEELSMVPNSVFAAPKPDLSAVAEGIKPFTLIPPHDVPGLGTRLNSVHPAFKLLQARPDGFEPRVGGMDFMEDGRLVISTWDPAGSVYILDGVTGDDPEKITIKHVAAGLAEPLGLTVVDGDIYVMQKQELTRLIDHDGDDLIDEYQLVSNDWGVSDNFHEFAFGLLYEDGHFYATLASDVLPGGNPATVQPKDRGTVIRIAKDTGEVEFMARGVRTPNGIGYGIGGAMYVADNQGNWLPASKIVRLEEGAFYGFRSVDPERDGNATETPPVVWLPQHEIGNSPSTPARLTQAPYGDQMIHGEVTHGGLKRVYAEDVNGQMQGCVFRFTQGLEAGINRIMWGPDGALYMGGVGNPGNWGDAGKQWFGLQKLVPQNEAAFEILSVRAHENGLMLTFTKPLRLGDGNNPAHYDISQWRYVPTAQYGGPKVDEETLRVSAISISEDRTRAFLQIDGLKPGHMVRLRAATPPASADGDPLWAPETWCTNTALNDPVTDYEETPMPAPNTLSPAEEAAGWKLLFDGTTTSGWRNFKAESTGPQWQVIDGALTLTQAGGGDIVSAQTYTDFELSFEWKVSEGGNSGVFYHVLERDDLDRTWKSGIEMQILDDDRHSDGATPKHRAGAVYGLYAPAFTVTRPVGEFNEARIVMKNGKGEHWMNGHKLAAFDLASDEWKALVAGSKFAQMPHFALGQGGHIALQDHGDVVAYRNIKIRDLSGE